MKTHLATGEPAHAVCNRGRRLSSVVTRVDCGLCRNSEEFKAAWQKRQDAIEADFAAQTPRTVRSMFGDYDCTCSCGSNLFRERPRSLLSFHFVCEGCGTAMFPPTETGMCQ